MIESSRPQQTESDPSAGLSQAVLHALPEPVFLLDILSGALRPMNSAAERWSGGVLKRSDGSLDSAACFPELDAAAVTSSVGRSCFTHCVSPATGQLCEVELHLNPLADDANQQVIVMRPIGAAAGEEWQLHGAIDNAFHDPLTGLPNRRLFARRLKRAVERANRGNYYFAVLFVDLDQFKNVNDRFGHLQGDQLLLVAGRRLLAAVRPQDMVARRDGDEFTILLDDLVQPEDAANVAQRIVEHLQTPLSIAEGDDAAQITLGASVGIALSGNEALNADEMLAQADAAMYQAKALGGGTYMMRSRFTDPQNVALHGGKPLPR